MLVTPPDQPCSDPPDWSHTTKKLLPAAALTLALAVAAPLTAQADTVGSGLSASDAATTAALVARADDMLVVGDTKAAPRKGTVSVDAAYGTYPTRKGVILVTPDKFKGLIPTGHAGIIYASNTVVEALSNGVTTGVNNWRYTKTQAYGVSVRSTTTTQDSTAANWAYGKRGKPYNWNYLDTATRAKFYCSHLVWASFKDNFGIDLNTSAYLGAVHPMELVDTDKTYLIWRKA